jgi:hypothetical protein
MLSAEERTYREGSHGRGELRYVEGVPVMTLEGTPQDIAEQEAALSIGVVRPLLGMPKQILQEQGSTANVGWPIIAGLAKGMLSRAPERYRQEIDAAAKAAHLTQDETDALIVANVMVELRRIGGCSALIVEPTHSAAGEMLFGRNFDFPTFGQLDRLGIVMVVRPQGHNAFVSVGFPGLTGVVSGMNEKGLAIATLDVYSSNDDSPMFDPLGVPLALTYRQVLEECGTVEEAEKLLKQTHHTTWMNLAACDAHRAVVFEITPRQVVARSPEKGALVCANSFRSEALRTQEKGWRFEAIEQMAHERPKLERTDVQHALHAANQGDMTIQTMIFEPETRVLNIALGKPPVSALPMTRIELKPYFQAKAE